MDCSITVTRPHVHCRSREDAALLESLRASCAVPPNSAAKSTEPGDVATNGQSMNIMGAFVSGDRLEVHQMPDHRITISDAHGAEEVARFTRTFQRHPDVVALRQRDQLRPDRAHFHHAGETQGKQLRLGDFLHHPNQFFLHQLEPGNRTTKLLARFGVSQRGLVAINSRPNYAPGHAHPCLRKTRERRFQSRSLGQTILRRYAAIFEPAFRRARHAQTELSLNIVRAKPTRVFLHYKSTNTTIVVFRPYHFYIRDGGIADPTLAAVQNVMIALAAGARLHTAWVRAVSMFR